MMKVYAAEICTCPEYGCMELYGIYSTEEKAHKDMKARGFQNEDQGESYDYRGDYYEVTEMIVE